MGTCRALAERIVSHHPGERNKEWKEAVKQEYIDTHEGTAKGTELC